MQLTRFGLQGLLFYFVTLGAFYASPYSNLFFLLLSFLTLQGLVGIAAAHRNLHGATAQLGELPPVPSGAQVLVSIEVSAPPPARFQLEARIEFEGRDGDERPNALVGIADLVDGSATLQLRAASLARGCYPVRRARLTSSHPFGLVRATRTFAAPAELVVYPAPRSLVEGRSMADDLGELLGTGDATGGDLQPSGLRDHTEGDEVRAIHWRASARRGALVVREWEGGRGQGLEVVVDRRCGAEQLEEALGTVSALVHLARTNKETLRIHSQDLSATYGDGQRPWSEALRFLAAAQALPKEAAPPPPTSPSVARLPQLSAAA